MKNENISEIDMNISLSSFDYLAPNLSQNGLHKQSDHVEYLLERLRIAEREIEILKKIVDLHKQN